MDANLVAPFIKLYTPNEFIVNQVKSLRFLCPAVIIHINWQTLNYNNNALLIFVFGCRYAHSEKVMTVLFVFSQIALL